LNRGAIILCGGGSNRMGRDKAALPFGRGETLLQRVVRIVGEAVPPEQIVCVAAAGQPLPQLPAPTRIARDRVSGGGPLAALAAGLAALADASNPVDAVFATGCDAPLLTPAFIRRVFDLIGEDAIAAPHDGNRWHPLAAVYRVSISTTVESLLAAGERSLVALLENCQARPISLDALRDVDPQLESLATCNTMADYHACLLRAGLPRAGLADPA
jgi:molybdopterin-guanine dinucleotide biosynthesis protein A